jgi:hypothetical protein
MIGLAMRGFGSPTLIAWVACLLTFGASGDDINLLRLVLPADACLATSHPLPLDDPNTDFTLPAKCSTASFKDGVSRLPAFCWGNHVGASPVSKLDSPSLLIHFSATPAGFRSNRLNPPLRC